MKKFFFVFLLIIFNSSLIVCFDSKVSIGNRVDGDKFLAGDKLYSKTRSPYPTNLTINFQYPIDNLVTCIILSSENNALIEFDVKYDGTLFGKAVAINATSFELTVSIYGFEKGNVPKNFESIFNDQKIFKGLLDDDFNDDDDFDEIDNPEDTVMKFGEKQSDDTLLYETWKHSPETTTLDEHFVVFYFVDNVYLTYTKFTAVKTKTASVTYSNVSDRTMKAIIHDKNVTSLNVHFSLHGYKYDNKPDDYKSLISNIDAEFMKGIQCFSVDDELQQKSNKSIKNHLSIRIIITAILITLINFL